MKTLKWIAIVVISLVVIGLLLPDSDNKTTEKTEKTQTSKDDIEVLKLSETAVDRTSTVHVEVKNNTSDLLSAGQIKVIYEDESGNIVGTGIGTILNLAAGATKVVDCLAMDIEGASTYRVEVTPLVYE